MKYIVILGDGMADYAIDEFGGKTGSPFFPVPVQTVNGDDHLFAEPLGQKGEKGRALRMDMHHIVTSKGAAQGGKAGGRHRSQTFFLDGGH